MVSCDLVLARVPRLTEEAATTLTKAWEGAHKALAGAGVKTTIMANQLVDMDWKFGVTAASGELAQVPSRDLAAARGCRGVGGEGGGIEWCGKSGTLSRAFFCILPSA